MKINFFVQAEAATLSAITDLCENACCGNSPAFVAILSRHLKNFQNTNKKLGDTNRELESTNRELESVPTAVREAFACLRACTNIIRTDQRMYFSFKKLIIVMKK